MRKNWESQLPIRKYRIVYHRIPAVIGMLTERKKGEPGPLEIMMGRKGAHRV